uniref:Uncharacterized protein n=1 Tax=Panagrolaimus sp. JU765 TaxID=591449 RepID=A0AC34QPB6_9BILA
MKMPQFLPLRQGENLPLYINRSAETTSFSFIRCWRSLHRKQRNFLLLLTFLTLLGFAYTQFYTFSGQIQTAENREAADFLRKAKEQRVS